MIAKKIVKPLGVLEKYKELVDKTDTIRALGSVVEVIGNIVLSSGPKVHLGDLCHIEKIEEEKYVLSEVVGFRNGYVVLSPLENITGVYPGAKVLSMGGPLKVKLGEQLLGRVLNGIGKPIDDKGSLFTKKTGGMYNDPPNPLERPLIRETFVTGIKSIDSFLTMGKGQRVGIFSGSGVGKSTLMGMIARFSKSDVNVIALIGERGREVLEFIENELGEQGLKKSVIIVASANDSPMNRVRAAYLATSIAEYFRDEGKDVLLMMDSLTRLAMAQREVGLGAGEPATTKGYPPSVFSILPELIERAGNSRKGSITAVYTVLVEADDLNEPIADAARGMLDGHIVLSRKLAGKSHYPAVEIVESISRSMPFVTEKQHWQKAAKLREYLAEYQENEEIINLGAYISGSNHVLDMAIRLKNEFDKFLNQEIDEVSSFDNTFSVLNEIYQKSQSGRESGIRRVR
ncbi:MAG: FliI/YscN family ATPase [Spirochaetia bacterium]|nr:FliI/YscN family ATPase [Spirochaetia bacterium]